MKPYYSIEELANILGDTIYKVSDGLTASRVNMICNGIFADLSQWESSILNVVGQTSSIVPPLLPEPHPSRVQVAYENLPQSWKDCIDMAGIGAQLFLNKASTTYAPELDIALKAWREVSATKGKGKPKARIKAWLDTNTKLSSEAKERIAIVANWDKTGGATRTD